MRKALGILVITMLTLSVVACSGGSSTPQSTSASSAKSATEPVAQPTKAPSSSASKDATSQPASASKASSGTTAGSDDLEKVPMPANPIKYDPNKPVKIGDALDLTDADLVLQVHGAKTVDYDAKQDIVVVELTIGNKKKEKESISSMLLMQIVTGDWKWYGLGMEELTKVAMKAVSLGLRNFDAEIPAGEARKGTYLALVPKDAKELAFAFTPMHATKLTSMATAVYVPLGIRGDFPLPILPENAEAVKAGSTYKIGQPVKFPTRGIILQVNGMVERADSAEGRTVEEGKKIVFVDVTANVIGDAKPINSDKEFILSASGDRMAAARDMKLVQSENGEWFSESVRRGLLAYTGPKEASGLQLTFRAMDPKSNPYSPDYLDDETAVFDLGK